MGRRWGWKRWPASQRISTREIRRHKIEMDFLEDGKDEFFKCYKTSMNQFLH